jgi:hypothetical protein
VQGIRTQRDDHERARQHPEPAPRASARLPGTHFPERRMLTRSWYWGRRSHSLSLHVHPFLGAFYTPTSRALVAFS